MGTGKGKAMDAAARKSGRRSFKKRVWSAPPHVCAFACRRMPEKLKRANAPEGPDSTEAPVQEAGAPSHPAHGRGRGGRASRPGGWKGGPTLAAMAAVQRGSRTGRLSARGQRDSGAGPRRLDGTEGFYVAESSAQVFALGWKLLHGRPTALRGRGSSAGKRCAEETAVTLEVGPAGLPGGRAPLAETETTARLRQDSRGGELSADSPVPGCPEPGARPVHRNPALGESG